MNAAVLYALAFAALTAADFATTAHGLARGGSEVNALVADAEGGLSGRFLLAQAAFGLAFAALFGSGWSRLRSATPVAAPPRAAPPWPSYLGHLVRGTPFGYVAAGTAVLLTKAVVPVSNLSAAYLGASVPGAVRAVVGTGPALMWLTIGLGIAFGVVAARWVAPWLVRAASQG